MKEDAQAPALLSHAPIPGLAHGREEVMMIPQAPGHDLSVPGDDYAMEPPRTKSDDGLATVVTPDSRAFNTTRPSPPSFAQSEFHMVRKPALCVFSLTHHSYVMFLFSSVDCSSAASGSWSRQPQDEGLSFSCAASGLRVGVCGNYLSLFRGALSVSLF
jgi:hypothetical protein